MKKLLALLVVAAMLFCFASCTEKPSESDVRGEQTVVSDNEKDNDNDSIENNNSDDDDEDNDGFSFGKTSGLKYENKFIGIGCKLDSDWSFYADEQIREINNITSDAIGDELAEAIKNASIIYDMYAINSNQMDNINVNLEKADPAQIAALDIKENYKAIFPYVKQGLENMGYTDISYTIDSVKIGNKEFPCMRTTAQINGITMYQALFEIKCEGYLANVTITSFEQNTIDSIISKFYIVK